MLKKAKGCEETLVHVCKQGRNLPLVYLHDVKSYMLISKEILPVKYCPYCGVVIEEDERED